MKNHTVMWRVLSLVVALFAALSLTFAPVLADDDHGNNRRECRDLPSHAELTAALCIAVTGTEDCSSDPAHGGFSLHMWATIVNRDGIVCAVTHTGENRGDQWPGSRVISAQKANAANAFSLDGLALSTAQLWEPTRDQGSLAELEVSNPVNTAVAYRGRSRRYGTTRDPMVGRKIGGVNVFGGGLALYGSGIIGALGVSGDSSCEDHVIAWNTRVELGLDGTPTDDSLTFLDAAGGTGGFGHAHCLGHGADDTNGGNGVND
jgi:uncharacterized protein GlcG (DUF336 family)